MRENNEINITLLPTALESSIRPIWMTMWKEKKNIAVAGTERASLSLGPCNVTTNAFRNSLTLDWLDWIEEWIGLDAAAAAAAGIFAAAGSFNGVNSAQFDRSFMNFHRKGQSLKQKAIHLGELLTQCLQQELQLAAAWLMAWSTKMHWLTVRKEKATKEIAEIFSLSFPQIADKIQRRGLQQ